MSTRKSEPRTATPPLPAAAVPAASSQVRITDDLDLLLAVMPPEIEAALRALGRPAELLEVVLDLGRIPEARFAGEVVDLAARVVTAADVRAVVERVGLFGLDNRAGIGGTLHRISALRNRRGDIIGLTCRVGRAVYGTVDVLRDTIEAGRSILLLGRPGVGKTTLLREAARVLADELGKRVVVVDTSNEIAGDGDVPHPGIGRARRMQVPAPSEQHAVMIEAVENHMPEVIVIDEIGTAAEAMAARTIAERGVQLVATAHGNALENLLRNPTLSDLVGGIHAVTLSDEEARRRGSQKTVLERKAPATFDVVVEIQQKDRFAVHHEVGEVIDRYLRGAPLAPELRLRGEDGAVTIEAPAATRGPAARRAPWAAGDPQADPEEAGPETVPRPLRRRLRIFPYAVAKSTLERTIHRLRAPAAVAAQLRDADVMLTVKAFERREPGKLREAQKAGVRVVVLRSNTQAQVEAFLRSELGLDAEQEQADAALREVEDAIDQVLTGGRPVELVPRGSVLRRLQHQRVEEAGLTSQSRGQEPFRRLVVFAG